MAKWNDPEATPWLSFMIEVTFSCSSLKEICKKNGRKSKSNIWN
jgi:hypothetical protein